MPTLFSKGKTPILALFSGLMAQKSLWRVRVSSQSSSKLVSHAFGVLLLHTSGATLLHGESGVDGWLLQFVRYGQWLPALLAMLLENQSRL